MDVVVFFYCSQRPSCVNLNLRRFFVAYDDEEEQRETTHGFSFSTQTGKQAFSIDQAKITRITKETTGIVYSIGVVFVQGRMFSVA